MSVINWIIKFFPIFFCLCFWTLGPFHSEQWVTHERRDTFSWQNKCQAAVCLSNVALPHSHLGLIPYQTSVHPFSTTVYPGLAETTLSWGEGGLDLGKLSSSSQGSKRTHTYTHTHTSIRTHIHTYGQFRVITVISQLAWGACPLTVGRRWSPWRELI